MSIFREKYSLPGPSAKDVLTQRLKVEAANTTDLTAYIAANSLPQGAFPLTIDTPASQATSDWIYFELPDTITLTLTNIDKSGNESAQSTRVLDEVDDVAPPAPDSSGINVTEKEQVE